MNFTQTLNLTREFIRTDFKLRYHGSSLGVFWSFLKPLLTFGVLLVVFRKFLGFQYEDYALNLLLGIILWTFFADATASSMSSMIEKGGLIKKIYFPRAIILLSSTAVAFITLLSNLAVFAVFYLFLKGTLDWTMLLFPLFIVEIYLVTLGVSLFLAAVYTKFRDLFHIWQVLLQVGFWATPIVYPLRSVPEDYRVFILSNPLAGIIENSRFVLINHQLPGLASAFYAFVLGLAALGAGYYIFSKRVPFFAEEV
jgi:ABC-type polysaccharide/polyol phosphate export permease